jgi:malonate-semialdehyde dehydrogenase (acetylating)/methylmalonate-semialdehyde dehydrogenase
MPDANLDYTAGAIAGAAFGAAGERCMALSVAVVIGDQTADELCEHLLAKMKDIKVGNGLEANMDMGPLVNKAHKEKVENYIQLGTEEGASLLADGRNIYPDNPGYFVGPTLFDKVTESMRIYQEEIFGPVLCVIRAASFEEAVALINRHQFGNGTAIFTHDGYAARQFASEVQAGMVGINIPIPVPVAYHPFGGWKRSVFGDMNMHGEDSIKFYTKQKTITSRWIKDDVTQNNFVMPTLGE